MHSRRFRWSFLAGFVLVLAGASARSILVRLLSSDRQIDDPLVNTVLLVAQIVCVVAGLAIILLPLPAHRLRRGATNAVVAGISVLLVLVGLEVLLRAYPIGLLRPPSQYKLPLLQAHASGGFSLRPNLDLRVRFGGQSIPIVTNAQGMRGPEVATEKSAGCRRIALLGDSFAFGEWARDREHALAGILETLLGRDCEVLNFGVPSYGLLEMHDQILSDVLPLDPDVIVVVFFTGNDFSDTYLGRERYRLVDGTAVWDSLHLQSRIDMQAAARPHAPSARRLLESMRVFTFSKHSLAAIRKRGSGHGSEEFVVATSPLAFSYWSRTDVTPHVRDAVAAVERTLEAMISTCREHGVQLALVALPYAAQVSSRQLTGPGFDVRLPQAHLETIARNLGLPYLDLLPSLRCYALETGTTLYWDKDPHFNDAGHLVAGLCIASFLQTHIATIPVTARAASR